MLTKRIHVYVNVIPLWAFMASSPFCAAPYFLLFLQRLTVAALVDAPLRLCSHRSALLLGKLVGDIVANNMWHPPPLATFSLVFCEPLTNNRLIQPSWSSNVLEIVFQQNSNVYHRLFGCKLTVSKFQLKYAFIPSLFICESIVFRYNKGLVSRHLNKAT